MFLHSLHKSKAFTTNQLALFLLCFCFFYPIIPANSSTNETVYELLLTLKGNDKKNASAAAEQLMVYPYREVYEALVSIIQYELSQANPNTFIAGAAIRSLGKIATAQHTNELIALQTHLNALIANGMGNKSFPYLLSDLKETIKLSSQKPNKALKRLEIKKQALAERSSSYVMFKDLLNTSSSTSDNSLNTLLLGTSQFLSDEIAKKLSSQELFEIFGRDSETQQALDILTREKGKSPILVGPRGAGKTSIVQKIARTILEGNLPAHPVFQKELAGAVIIETTPARISRLARANDNTAQAAALELYFDAVLDIEKKLNIKIIIFMDEIHTLGPGQVEALKPYLDSRDRGIRLIGASTSVEFQNAFKMNPAIQRRFDVIGVSEQSAAEVKQIIMFSEKARTEKRYGFTVSEEAVDVIIQNANRVYPDTSLVDAASKMLMTICSVEARQMGQSICPLEITAEHVYQFTQNKLGFPVNPLNLRALNDYKQILLNKLNQFVTGQPRMVSDVVDEWIRLLKNNRKGVRSVMLLGPTGVGKSFLGRELAKAVFGSEGAFLEVDANQFKDGSLSNNTFFGAPLGVRSSDKTAGQLFDYLDDPGKGKFGGIILINEAERAHPDFWEKMMEIMDTGKASGADGKERLLSRHLIILTSNRGDVALYPKTLEDWTPSEYQAHMLTLTESRLRSVFQEASSGKDTFRLPDPILARIDKFTAAEPMTLVKTRLLAYQKAQSLLASFEEQYQIKFKLDPQVTDAIANLSYQKGLGARPVEKKTFDLIEQAIDNYLTSKEALKDEELAITLAIHPQSGEFDIMVNGLDGEVATRIDRPQNIDLLNDPQFLKRLSELKLQLAKRVYGQEEMLERIQNAVIAHQATQSKRPLSLFTVGTTGTGKTETAKALAQALYQSENRVLVLDLGQIIYEGELSNIFGSPVGHTGSQEERIFEKFLRENPQGGVIVLDEISNMGGKDLEQKQALFKKFYSIFEEGTWLSPATNKTYSLAKYTFINTGNDLEGLLQGIHSDENRIKVWNQYKNPSIVRSLLIKAGVPEAFLGRMGDVILMKPLTQSEIKKIAQKILQDQLQEFELKNLKFEITPLLTEQIAQLFFTQSQGARSIRNLIEFRLKSVVVDLIIKANGISQLQNKTIKFLITDTQSSKHYVQNYEEPRQVMLKAMIKGQNTLESQVNVTDFTDPGHKLSKKALLQSIYHEVGQSVLRDQLNPLAQFESIRVAGYKGEEKTQARFHEILSVKLTETELINQMAIILGGMHAESLAGFPAHTGHKQSLNQARQLASQSLLSGSISPLLNGISINELGKLHLDGNQQRIFQSELTRLFLAAEKLAKSKLTENWNLVRQLSLVLYTKGELSREQFIQSKSSSMSQDPSKASPTWKAKNGKIKLIKSTVLQDCETSLK